MKTHFYPGKKHFAGLQRRFYAGKNRFSKMKNGFYEGKKSMFSPAFLLVPLQKKLRAGESPNP